MSIKIIHVLTWQRTNRLLNLWGNQQGKHTLRTGFTTGKSINIKHDLWKAGTAMAWQKYRIWHSDRWPLTAKNKDPAPKHGITRIRLLAINQ